MGKQTSVREKRWLDGITESTDMSLSKLADGEGQRGQVCCCSWCLKELNRTKRDFPRGSDSKASVYNAGDPGSIPGSGRSPGEGNGNLLQYCCLENPMDRETWWATVQEVAKSGTQLRDLARTDTLTQELSLLE